MKNLLSMLIIAVLASVGTHYWFARHESGGVVASEKRETAYERIMRTGVIRCGYAVWNPIIAKDPNTGDISGVFYDYLNALGKKLDLKVEWTSELNFATYLSDLNYGKFDLECSGGLPDATRGKFVEYTQPIFYTPLYVFVKNGVAVYDNKLRALNAKDKSFVSIDGTLSGNLAKTLFPQSRTVGLPGTSPLSDMLEQVAYGKADAFITDAMFGAEYMAKRPNTIRRVVSPPLTVTSYSITVPAGETRLAAMLNTATNEMLFDGTIESILRKHNLSTDIALRVAAPYSSPPPQK